MLHRSLLSMLVLAVSATGCSNTVHLPEGDEEAPTAQITVFDAYSISTLGGVQSGGRSATVRHLADHDIALFATVSDSGGVKRAELQGLFGGMLEPASGNQPASPVLVEPGSSQRPQDAEFIYARPVYPNGSATLSMKARGEDFAGNSATTPTLTLERLTPVAVSLSASSAHLVNGQSTTLTWEIRGTNLESAELTDHRGNVVVASTGASGSKIVSPSFSTTYTLSARPLLPQPKSEDASAEVHIPVTQAPGDPVIALRAFDTTIPAGDEAVLLYESANAYQVEIPALGFGPSRATSGSVRKKLDRNTTVRAFALDRNSQRVAESVPVSIKVQVPATINVFDYAVPPGDPDHDYCSASETQIDVSSSDVRQGYGVYPVVSRVHVSLGGLIEKVRIRRGAVTHTVGYSLDDRPEPMWTDAFNGEDVTQGAWCFDVLNSDPSPYGNVPFVTFTLER